MTYTEAEIEEILELKEMYDALSPDDKHVWYRTWMTGNTVCERCKLFPLDPDDTFSVCPGK